LRLEEQVFFLGFVSPEQMQALYARCRLVAIPTQFEAASGPLWEAFRAGAAAACSRVTSLPDQAGDAALFFNPEDATEIAEALRRLWIDDRLRATLIARGRRRVAPFTWERSARIFRAHYRRLARRPLTDADRELLASSPRI
jgi:glycosyltransferase involved in cell wall biosynthesis